MTVSLKHLFQSSIPDDPDTSIVRPSDWNAEHTLTLDTGKLLGRSSAGTGAAEEITVGTGLSLSGGTLSNSQSTTLTVGTTATSGGAAGQIMFDTGSVLQESSNLVWDNTAKRLTISGYSLTGTAADSLLDLSGTWNTTGVPTAIKLNVTDTASNASSLLMDLQVGGVKKFAVFKNGNLRLDSRLAATGITQVATIFVGTNQPLFLQGYRDSSNNTWVGFAGNYDNSASQIAIDASGRFCLDSTNQIRWSNSSGNTFGQVFDLFLTRRGAANLRFGAADAAAPVAQTLSVQSVVAGTTNTAGANLTITGSQGTGTGAGGNIIFQTSASGASGTAQNALSTVMTLSGGNQWIYFNNAEASLIVQKSSVAKFALYSSGSIQQVTAASDWAYGWSSTTTASGVNDTNLTRKAANNIRLGLADAAAPVAQTLSVQSVVAGTTDTAGANLTITGSQGTGTGAGGSIIFQVAPAGSSGTAQNALATAMTIAPAGLGGAITVSGGTGSGNSGDLNSFTFNNVSANSFKNQFNLSGAGVAKWAIGNDINGNKGDNFFIYSASGGTGGTVPFYIDGVNRQIGIFAGSNAHVFGFWNNTSGLVAGTLDVILSRRGAANLRFGAADAAAPVAQTLSVQSVVAGTSNTAGANLTITGSQGTGTGAGGSIIFQVAPAGSSGTAQNALVNFAEITSTRRLSLYNTFTSDTNFERANFFWDSNVLKIGTEKGSAGGTARALEFQTDGTTRLTISTTGGFTFSGVSVSFASSVTFANNRGTIAAGLLNSTNLAVYAASGKSLELFSDATSGRGIIIATGSGIVQFEGTTSSFPALKRSTTILQVRLADDSAYAPVEASTVCTATAYTVATLPAAGTAGRRAYVTDATAPTWLGALTGGGAVVCPVFDNGTAWVAG